MSIENCIRHPTVALSPIDGSCQACIARITPDKERKPYEDLQKEAAQQKRAFIEITRVKTKEVETQLTRIANALEQLLIEAYNFHTDTPTTDTSGPEPQVYYTDHDEQDIQEIVDDMKDR